MQLEKTFYGQGGRGEKKRCMEGGTMDENHGLLGPIFLTEKNIPRRGEGGDCLLDRKGERDS